MFKPRSKFPSPNWASQLNPGHALTFSHRPHPCENPVLSLNEAASRSPIVAQGKVSRREPRGQVKQVASRFIRPTPTPPDSATDRRPAEILDGDSGRSAWPWSLRKPKNPGDAWGDPRSPRRGWRTLPDLRKKSHWSEMRGSLCVSRYDHHIFLLCNAIKNCLSRGRLIISKLPTHTAWIQITPG